MRNLRDTDGENLAVRWFLAGYCKGGVTAKEMRKHMEMSGYGGAWPKWASDFNGHLIKAGAQLWIRHLFALEQQQGHPDSQAVDRFAAAMKDKLAKAALSGPAERLLKHAGRMKNE